MGQWVAQNPALQPALDADAKTWTVTTAEGLAYCAYMVNTDTAYASYSITLAGDIDLYGADYTGASTAAGEKTADKALRWEPIGHSAAL